MDPLVETHYGVLWTRIFYRVEWKRSFEEGSSVMAHGLCIGSPRLVGRRKAGNSNMQDRRILSFTTLYRSCLLPNQPATWIKRGRERTGMKCANIAEEPWLSQWVRQKSRNGGRLKKRTVCSPPLHWNDWLNGKGLGWNVLPLPCVSFTALNSMTHLTRSGRRFDLSYYQKFLLLMNLWWKCYKKMQKLKKSTEGT